MISEQFIRFCNHFRFVRLILLLNLNLILALNCNATVSLSWDAPVANTDNSPFVDFSHYLVKVGSGPSNSSFQTFNSPTASFQIESLQDGTYFAFVTAVNTNQIESTESNKIYFAIIRGGLDSDGDSLNDKEEQNLGTNPSLYDTDQDGISDGKEKENGTNPLDKGSHFPVFESKICAPWNGFLVDSLGRSMANIYEHINTSQKDLNVSTQILNSLGTSEESYNFILNSGLQRDILVHDFRSRKLNNYGNVCSQSSGDPGDLAGNMVYYKQKARASGFDFALAIKATAPIVGSQYLPFNTFNPSAAREDINNANASWIQLTNDNVTKQTGVLNFWRADGFFIKQVFIDLLPNSRRDIAIHEVGSGIVGFVEWVPSDMTARFKLDSTRYFGDNSKDPNSFEGAAYLPAFVPTGAVMGVVYDNLDSSAILELSNVLDKAELITVIAYSQAGVKIFETNLNLNKKSTHHFILDQFVPGQKGLLVVKPTSMNSVFGNLMQYKLKGNGGFHYLYAVPLVPPIGQKLVSAYNTYIGHTNELMVANFDSAAESFTVGVISSNGRKLMDNEPGNLPANGIGIYKINNVAGINDYGAVTVTASRPNTFAAWIVRERALEYRLPFQLTP